MAAAQVHIVRSRPSSLWPQREFKHFTRVRPVCDFHASSSTSLASVQPVATTRVQTVHSRPSSLWPQREFKQFTRVRPACDFHMSSNISLASVKPMAATQVRYFTSATTPTHAHLGIGFSSRSLRYPLQLVLASVSTCRSRSFRLQLVFSSVSAFCIQGGASSRPRYRSSFSTIT
jgi:hypothetical protein